MTSFLIQAVGVCAMAVLFSSFQFKQLKMLYIFQAVSSALFALHFGLLGAVTGMIMNLIGVLRSLILMWEGKRWAYNPVMLGVFVLATVGCGSIGFSFPISLFCVGAMCISMFTLWSGNGRTIRLWQLFCISPLWIIYNIFAGDMPSYAGILNEILNMTSVIVSIKRFGLKNLGSA